MKKAYIGYSNYPEIRFQASSGGVGSSIVKYLLDQGDSYALSFKYDKETLKYTPYVISSFEDYNVCGSIYQEIELPKLLKELIIPTGKSNIVLFSLPCQTKVIRKICEERGLRPLIIGLTCSSQQSQEATLYLLQRLGIKEDDVEYIRYRGNGWPSGVQILLKNGDVREVANLGSIWSDIFHSRLFIQKRCFSCKNTLNDFADIVLADPWIPDIIDNEKVGQTLFTPYTDLGQSVINGCRKSGFITCKEVEYSFLYDSQKSTIIRKEAYNNHPRIRKIIKKVYLSPIYKRIVKNPLLFKLHCIIKNRIEFRLIYK